LESTSININVRALQEGVQIVEVREDGCLRITVLCMRRSLVFSEVMQQAGPLSPQVLQALGKLLINAGRLP
jgi:hypothetical protein